MLNKYSIPELFNPIIFENRMQVIYFDLILLIKLSLVQTNKIGNSNKLSTVNSALMSEN